MFSLQPIAANSSSEGCLHCCCWRMAPHTTTAGEIYVLYVCWPGLIIQSNASEDPSMSRALSGSSRQNALFCFFFFYFFFLGWVVAAVTGRTKCDTVIRPWKGGLVHLLLKIWKHRRYRHYHHYFDHHTFIKCYGKFISFWKTELISDNTPQPGVCSSSLWDELLPDM